MISKAMLASTCLLVGILASPAPAGAAGLLTSHGESIVFTKICINGGVNCHITPAPVEAYGGGPGTPNGAASHPLSGNASASGAYVGPLATPQLKAQAQALSDPMSWSFGSTSVLQGYTWAGAAAMPVGFVGNLTYDLTQGPVAALAGLYASVWIVDASFVDANDPMAHFNLLDNIVSNPHNGATNPCSDDPGVIGFSKYTDTSGSGPQSAALSLVDDCTGNPLTVQPGQQFYMLARLTTSASYMSSADASHTFSIDLDPTTAVEARAQILANLLPTAAASVPEPATWAMMIIGFGAVGTLARSTRRRSAAAS